MFNMTTLIGLVISWIAGVILKKNPDFKNKLIPIVSFVIAILTQAVAAFQGQPTGALGMMDVNPTLLVGSIFSQAWFKIILQAAVQTVMATGGHSTVKNVLEGLKSTD